MPNPDDVGKIAGPRERVRLNMLSLKENDLAGAHLLMRKTWKKNGAVARAILNNANFDELVAGGFLSKDASFLRMAQRKDESNGAYVDRLWWTKMERCVNKGACRAAWESLRNAEVRRMDMEVFVNTVSMELQGMKEKFDNKYFQILDEKSFVAMAVQEITPNDYDGYVRKELFDMALQEGDLTKVPSFYDKSVSFGPWQMTKVAYEDLMKKGGLEAGLPAEFAECVSYEMQARAAIFYGYRRVLQIGKAIEGSANLKKIFEAADAGAQRKFLTALMAKGHNGGSGRLNSTLPKVKMAAVSATSLQEVYGQIFQNSEGAQDGLYARKVCGIYSEL